ncbi:MAG: YIP1 family protein [Chloroflexi bacterium]|nr:YIP1 family protein [Chloroflexota bacterium]
MDLRSSLQVWRRMISRPSEEVFADELTRSYARLSTAVIWLTAAGLVTVLVWMLIFLLLNPVEQSMDLTVEFLAQSSIPQDVIDETVEQMEQTAEASMFLLLCFFLIGIPLGTMLWSGLLWLIARAMGGSGSFEQQTYLIAAFTAPLVMLNAVLYLFPLLGPLLVLGMTLYMFYLTYFALKVVHQLSSGKTATLIITPVVALLVLGCCMSTLWLALLGTAVNGLA